MTTSVVLIGHGSKARGFEAPLKKVARDISRTKRFRDVVPAYLEINKPSIPEAIRWCVERGAAHVKVLPYFLLLGLHVTEDIPGIVAAEKKKHSKKAKVDLCPYLGYDRGISGIVLKRLASRAR